MQLYRNSFFPLFIILLFSSCTSLQKLETLKPEPDDATPIVYDTTPSFINLPIAIKLKDIENQTNSHLNGLIYDDSTIEDDDIEMKIWKLAPIKIKSNNDKVTTILPLRAEIKYRIGTKTMGIEMYDVRKFNLNGLLTLSSSVRLNNWQLVTSTELKTLEWNETPTMTVLGKNMPITYLINPALKLFKSKIEKSIDDAIEKSMDFKPNVIAALETISTPVKINDDYESWLRINPIEMYATEAKLNNDSMLMNMGLKCNMETIIGQQPPSKFNASKIVLKPVTKIPNQVSANIVAVSSYHDASKIMTKNFAGEEFGSGNKRVKVQDVKLWHKEGKMVIALAITGSINGSIYLAGFPKYDQVKKEIYFEDLDYVLDTKNRIMKTANWLGQGLILKKIQQNCRYSISENLEEGKNVLTTYLNNYSPLPGVYINGKTEDITFDKIELTNNAILALVKIKGVINITIDGLK
ncbi:DUF4403 family protein [Flavobacterium algicola]|uniref:DUF4403 family protein n=1 Tax=Flavobacterium algicola TaxID=556529 RepID=UPI001EFE055E|nr:DUF4403 family protein [Flavobacterium algicola]MCG9791496.1 DUF4403 family protein [Flavobacterium algicola]